MPLAWRELHDGDRGALWAGQSPHLLWLTPSLNKEFAVSANASSVSQDRRNSSTRDAGSDMASSLGSEHEPTYLLGLAGGYYVEDFGGADCHLICDAVVLEWVGGEQGLRAIYAVDQYGEPHPKLHGAAKAALPDGSFLFFGGGNPAGSTNLVTRLSAHPALLRPRPNLDEVRAVLDPTAQGATWVAIRQPDGKTSLVAPDPSCLPLCWSSIQIDGGPSPTPRHGLQATVHPETGDFLIFAGRGDAQSPGCFNDFWSLSVSRDQGRWTQVTVRGTPPPPKVWYGATTTRSGQWVIYGGSQWQFDEDSSMDRGVIYILALQSLTWSSISPAAGSPTPELVVACALVESEGSNILVFGGCMPHRLNSVARDRATAFELCPNWYVPLTQVWGFDLAAALTSGTVRWGLEDARADEVPEPGDTTLRSHLAAVAVPSASGRTGSAASRALVFGGSRYFTGAYFHDLLELRSEPSSASVSSAAQAHETESSVRRSTRSFWQRIRPGSAARDGAAAAARRPSSERRGSRTRPTARDGPRWPTGTGQRGRAGRLRAMARDGLMAM